MRGLRAGLCDFRRPPLALPVEAFGRRLVGHAFPPDAAFRRQRDVREDRVLREGGHRVRIGFADVPGATPKNPASGLIACRRPFASGLIQAMSSPTVQPSSPSTLPAESTSRSWSCRTRSETQRPHRSSRLADLRRRGSACAPPSSLHRAPCWRRYARRNTSCRAARCRHSRSRRTRFRASPESGRCTSLDCMATGRPFVRARAARQHCACTAPRAFRSYRSRGDRQTDAGHDPHVHDDIGRIGKLHTDLRHRRTGIPC